MTELPGHGRHSKTFPFRTVALCGLMFLTLTACPACSNPRPTLTSTATPVPATVPPTVPASVPATEPASIGSSVTPTPFLAPTSPEISSPGPGQVPTSQTEKNKASVEALPPGADKVSDPTATPTPATSAVPAATSPAEAVITMSEETPPPASPATDREILAMFYEATDGPNWEKNKNWLSSADLDDWYGVATDAQGRVTGLEFTNMRSLEGELPPELGNLTKLENLRISFASLSGQIPPELGNLANLRVLNLRKNNLSGALPGELGNLTNLEELDLYVNELSGPIPPELGRLSNLKHLNLGHNRLGGKLPPELGNLANLEYLGIILNQLTGELPPQLGNLSNLKEMDFVGNRLSGEIPPEMGRLVNLVELNLASNRLNGKIPPELGNMARVTVLKLDNNNLDGQVPAELANLNRLLELGLSRNRLDGCIPVGLKIHYYLTEQTSLSFCVDAPAPGGDPGETEVADFLGPSTWYIDPVLVSLLYAHRAGDAAIQSVRLAIAHVPELLLEPDLDTLITHGSGNQAGENVWEMPIELVPSVTCRADVFQVLMAEPDGTPSPEVRSNPYPNLHEALVDAAVAHQGGMPENQAALYSFLARGNSIAVAIQTEDKEAENLVRAWLDRRNIYAVPHPYGDSYLAQVLLPVSQIMPLAEQFPEAYLEAWGIREDGLFMLRSQWEPELLHFEKSLVQQYLDPESNPDEDGSGQTIAPCSP